jgi:transposase
MEIITGVERRRRWQSEEKLRILAELDEPGAKFVEVARRHEVSRGLLWQWRDAPRRGALVAEEPFFVPLRIVPELPPPEPQETSTTPTASSQGQAEAVTRAGPARHPAFSRFVKRWVGLHSGPSRHELAASCMPPRCSPLMVAHLQEKLTRDVEEAHGPPKEGAGWPAVCSVAARGAEWREAGHAGDQPWHAPLGAPKRLGRARLVRLRPGCQGGVRGSRSHRPDRARADCQLLLHQAPAARADRGMRGPRLPALGRATARGLARAETARDTLVQLR